MTPNVVPRRRTTGTPAGGQFAPTGRIESSLTLDGRNASPGSDGGGKDASPWDGNAAHTAPTGTLSGVDPVARAALMDEIAPTVTDPEGRYPVVTGPRFDSDPRRSSAEVARLLRTDLKAAQAAAALPPSAVFSVRSESFAGGQSVSVEIRNLPDREIMDDHPDYPRRLNRAARELERTVRRMANAYNRDASDRASDVYDLHYYAHVSIETEAGRRARQRQVAGNGTRGAGENVGGSTGFDGVEVELNTGT